METTDNVSSKAKGFALKSLADRKNIKRAIGAIGIIILTNIFKYLLSVDIISKWFFRIFGLPPSTYFYHNLRHIIIILLIGAYGVVFYFLYKRFIARFIRPRRILFSTLLMLGLASLFIINVYSLPQQPNAEALISTKEWSNKIAKSQSSNGGIRGKVETTYGTQVWTTAQALTGMLADRKDLDENKVKTIKAAFDYIEKVRHPSADDENQPDEGWGLFDDSKKSTTEIAGWVTVANIASVESKTKIWTDAELPRVLDRIDRDLKLILARQDEDNGGWRPIINEGVGFTRTYSTAIALWSLIEARRSKVVSDRIGNPYDPNISKGIDWLLKNYTKVLIDNKEQVLGWVPNPNRLGQRERFDGLTAQVLYILSRVENQPGFEYLLRNGVYLEAKKNFLKDRDVTTRFVCVNDRVHDFDLAFNGKGLDFVLEGSTLLWFPWTYAVLTNLSFDAMLLAEERTAAAALRKEILNSKVDDLNKFVEDEFIYVLAENLYCLSVSDEQVRSNKQ